MKIVDPASLVWLDDQVEPYRDNFDFLSEYSSIHQKSFRSTHEKKYVPPMICSHNIFNLLLLLLFYLIFLGVGRG